MTAFFSRLFGEGFRVFFLAAALFGVFAMLVWEAWLGVHALGGMVSEMPFGLPPHLWHAHEMIYGYAGAALAGFFLTAVPNWTGAKAARHVFIALAAGLWLAGRLAIWWADALPLLLVAAVDLAFLPLLAAKILTQLLRRPKPQNLMFLGILLVIWSGNLLVHLDWLGWGGPGAETGLRVGLLGVCALIAVLGGRVTPAFTRNAMTRAGRETGLPVSRKSLEIAGIASAIALPLCLLVGVGGALTGAVALVAGLTAAARLSGWRSCWTLRTPILWSLHLSYALLALGYAALGASELGLGSEVAALHLLGVGAVGGMTVAVMSRAILGHTGRPLVAPCPVAWASGLMAVAAAVRWVGSSADIGWYWAGMLTSGALWILALTLFLIALWPALSEPRVS